MIQGTGENPLAWNRECMWGMRERYSAGGFKIRATGTLTYYVCKYIEQSIYKESHFSSVAGTGTPSTIIKTSHEYARISVRSPRTFNPQSLKRSSQKSV